MRQNAYNLWVLGLFGTRTRNDHRICLRLVYLLYVHNYFDSRAHRLSCTYACLAEVLRQTQDCCRRNGALD